MATPEAALSHAILAPSQRTRHVDWPLLAGVAVAVTAILIGVRCSGVPSQYFFQPTGLMIVLGGTLGVILVTTPRKALFHSVRRLIDVTRTDEADARALIEEIVHYARLARRGGVLSLEPLLPRMKNGFLKEALMVAIDLNNREELETVLEARLRMEERQGERDARTFEIAGGYAPTIGIIGTVVGLIEVLRQFSNLQSVGSGIGTAFVSTIYGLALANLVLLPAGHRIRARVAETFETQELMVEGVLAIAGSVHPSLIRMRLNAFARGKKADDAA